MTKGKEYQYFTDVPEVKELGMNGTAVAKLLGITQSSVSRAVERGEELALDN